mmetsp:Transcript_29247/g.44891  ORF Transcript_29247/g.44891 Transcript_29247/m.44891 type:complete len:120 (-) Transcript_29247:269-628(-)
MMNPVALYKNPLKAGPHNSSSKVAVSCGERLLSTSAKPKGLPKQLIKVQLFLREYALGHMCISLGCKFGCLSVPIGDAFHEWLQVKSLLEIQRQIQGCILDSQGKLPERTGDQRCWSSL